MRSTIAQLPLRPNKASVAPSLDSSSKEDPLSSAGLFAGIGGIELGLSRSGHHASVLCEIDPAANAVLDAGFDGGIRRYSDIRKMRALPRDIELIAAGFPCQDLSQAGKTEGIQGSRSGLVGEVFRLLSKRRVEWVLLENVPFMLQLGRGLALQVVLREFERLGYRWAYRVVNSRAFGVPQRRERVYFLASLRHDPRDVLLVDCVAEPVDTRSFREVACGFYWTEGLRGLGWAVDSVPTLKGGSTLGIPSPPAIIFPNGRIATPEIRDAERLQGFEEDWTKPAETVSKRGARWKLVGNAVTVDASDWIGRRLRCPGDYDAAGDVVIRGGSPWPPAAYNVGDGRFQAAVTSWPVRRTGAPLAVFLNHNQQDLSEKATAGFLSRAERAKLRFAPGFLDAVRLHLDRMRATGMRAII